MTPASTPVAAPASTPAVTPAQLVAVCVAELAASLSAESMLEVLVLADDLQLGGLRAAALDYAAEHFVEVDTTEFMKAHTALAQAVIAALHGKMAAARA